ncbi:MAG: hypothetical protein M5U34_44610 [Chloroflexi bacterium]|nr:hypothetical protein [Chloroflexota bacterium]
MGIQSQSVTVVHLPGYCATLLPVAAAWLLKLLLDSVAAYLAAPAAALVRSIILLTVAYITVTSLQKLRCCRWINSSRVICAVLSTFWCVAMSTRKLPHGKRVQCKPILPSPHFMISIVVVQGNSMIPILSNGAAAY